jgi:hypothetical protein
VNAAPESNPSTVDANVEAVREKLLARSQRGILKYGTTTERTDLTHLQWLKHLHEELMDATVYNERLIQNEAARCERERMMWLALKNLVDAVDVMNHASNDGLNVHGAVSGLIGALDEAKSILASSAAEK